MLATLMQFKLSLLRKYLFNATVFVEFPHTEPEDLVKSEDLLDLVESPYDTISRDI